jgi:N-acetylmuramoyl-L-alanine amidase
MPFTRHYTPDFGGSALQQAGRSAANCFPDKPATNDPQRQARLEGDAPLCTGTAVLLLSLVQMLEAVWMPVAADSAAPPVEIAAPEPAVAACHRADFRIAIDVGHTETSYGAVSAHGKPEFDFNLRLARELVARLWSDGFQRAEMVIQTDNDLQKRARDLSSRRPNLMLSLHHDSVQDKYLKTAELDGQMRTFTDGFRGYSIFVSHDNIYRDDSDRFAKLLGGEMLAQGLKPTFHHHEQENRPILDSQVGVFQYDGLVVLKQTTAPAVLLESAVITNPEDEAKADDPAYRNRITNAIVAAITRFCETAATRSQPRATPAPAPKPAAADKPGGRK